MKYVAWVYENHIYKDKLLHNLTYNELISFIRLFRNNKKKAEYILNRRLRCLLQLPLVDVLVAYSVRELGKLAKLTIKLSLDNIITMLSYVELDKLTIYNVEQIYMYVTNYLLFANKKVNIVWGPGNHPDPATNIKEHYAKHVLSSDEGKYWSSVITDCKSYEQYAINSFYHMKNVIIHTNGRNVYISGFYNNVFIVGRYHKNVFGISSCYYVESGEKPGRKENLCFRMKWM